MRLDALIFFIEGPTRPDPDKTIYRIESSHFIVFSSWDLSESPLGSRQMHVSENHQFSININGFP